MKIRNMLIILLAFAFIFVFITPVHAASEPAANASKSKIEKYVKNNDVSKTNLNKLVPWYIKTKNNKIKTAILSKSSNEVSSYVNSASKSELEDFKKTDSGTFGSFISKINNTAANAKINSLFNEASSQATLPSDGYEQSKKQAEAVNTVINPDDYEPSSSGDDSLLSNRIGTILGVVQTIGSFVALGTLIVIGIKYMLGSVEERAEYKKTMIPYVIGAVILFSITNLVNMIYQVFS